jgi:hypothetical protein
MASVKSLDSLVASEFEVEINGSTLNGIFRISNLTTLKFDENGKRHKPPFEIAKMVQRDANNPFNAWLTESAAARDNTNRPTRDIIIKAVDDGVVTRTWTVKNATILGVSYSDFNSASFEMVEEVYTIGYGDIVEEFKG